MFPMCLRHDAVDAPIATAYVADAVPGDNPHAHWCQMAAYWAEHAGLPFFIQGAPSLLAGAPSDSGHGSAYVLWSAQLISQIDVDLIAAFKAAAAGFPAVEAPTDGDATAAAAPLYCRYLLVRRADGRLVSGNAARAIIGSDALPPATVPLTAAAARDREIAHDDSVFLLRAPVETHVALAARLPDYFVFVRLASRYFSLRFGAIVVTVGVRPVGGAAAAAVRGGSGGGNALVTSAVVAAGGNNDAGGGGASWAAGGAEAQPAAGGAAGHHAFLAAEEDGGVTLVTVAEEAVAGGWTVHEEPPAPAELALSQAGFFVNEGTNAASIQLPLEDVVALLTGWGWVQISPEDLV